MNLTDVDDDGAKALASAIHKSRTLRKITLFTFENTFSYHSGVRINYPCVSGNTAAKLIHVFMDNFTLQEFFLTNRLDSAFHKEVCKLFEDAALPQALQQNTCVRSISLSHIVPINRF